MKKCRLLWAVPPLALILVMASFVPRPDRESRTTQQFEAHRAVLEELAVLALEQGSAEGIEPPTPWRDVEIHRGECPCVEFSFGSGGFASETTYWGVNYVPCGHTMHMRSFYGMGWETRERNGDETVYFEPEGDNTCYVKKLDDCWYYYEMSF